MIYLSAIYADAEHTQVTGTDADGNTETRPISHPHEFRREDEFITGFLAGGGVIADYEPPAPPHPNTIELPRREFRRALLQNGMDTAAILAVINAIPDAIEREEMMIWWEDTQLIQRHHPVLVQMVAAAGLVEAQADAIWADGVALFNGG